MSLPALLADYLFIGAQLAARLRDQVADVPVEVVETPEQLLRADQRARVLYVLWAGDRFGERAGGRSQQMWQRWLVVLAIKNVGAQGDARHQKAGPLLSQVHRAVVGWTPDGAVLTFARADAPMRPDIRKDQALYPLGFEIQLSL